jgi:hypothetical protein
MLHDAVAFGAIAKERKTTMNYRKLLQSKTLWLGTLGLATMLLGSAPTCKAQESSPAHFTDTGVEDAYPATTPLAKKPVKVQRAASPMTLASDKALARRHKARKTARKHSEVSASGL